MKTQHIIVVRHNERWHAEWSIIRRRIVWRFEQSGIADCLVAVEHVGSTAVCGLWAKPILDVDLVYRTTEDLPSVIEALQALEYIDEGDLGIKNREAFTYRQLPGLMAHHLYACPQNSSELNRHIVFRNYLQTHPEAVGEYSRVKREAAQRYPDDIENYMAYKAPVIEHIYQTCGLL
ncbi:GrpB family protein [Bombiscardovia coagulans]|uniref:Glutamate-rich protein GrpB n=1 Tax=Bombiscardovia coagulans TaxID=686666 RepID=A0A261EP77_9BIFI|nr:GrpB family protein [Bombiscardovia coagulans]OZG48659.1 glutamate-rich protein GrpB [Bombiscardovia coagulans]